MNKSRFVRKGNSNKQTEAIKEKYDQFLMLAFRLLGEGFDYKEKTEIIQNEYASITDPNIERNEVFLQRIINLKNQMQAKPNENVIQYFTEALLFLYQSNIISHIDYIELIDLQKKPEAPIYPPEEPEIIVKRLSYLQKVEARQESQESSIGDIVQFKTHAELEEASLMQYIDSMLETSEMRKKKETILAYMGDIINKINFNCLEYDCQTTFTLYGSHVNEISLPSSDIDISLDTNYEGDPRDFLRFFLKEIKSDLEARYDIEVLQLLSQNVSVPVIEVVFKEYDVTISFSMNNKLGAINSRLLKIYSRLDKRCKTLCLAVKLWAKAHGIISAKENYLSSYAYNLMVINFLQTRDPPILPSLQKLRSDNLLTAPKYITIKRKHRDERVESFKTRVDFEDDMVKLDQIMKQKYSDNKTTVVDLLKDFFAFYGDKANFEVITLSIKKGKHIRRNPLNQDYSFFYSIEDPFDRFRNAGRHIKKGIMHEKYAENILNSMQESRTLLDNGHILEIFGLNINDEL